MRARAALLGLLISGCQWCSEPEQAPAREIALVSSTSGTVRVREREGASQRAAARGDRVYATGELRTGADGTADVFFSAGGALEVVRDTLVRFLDRPPGFEVVGGSVIFEPGPTGLRFGPALFDTGSRIRVSRVAGTDTSLTVLLGAAILDDGRRVGVGSTLVVDVGMALLDVREAGEPPPPTRAEQPEPEGVLRARLEGGSATLARGGDTRRVAPGDVGVEAGDRIDLPQGVALEVSRGTEQMRVVGAASIVLAPAGGALVEARRGTVSASGRVRIQLPGGAILVDGAVDADVGERTSFVRTRRGTTTVTATAAEGEARLEPGEWASVEHGGEVARHEGGPSRVHVAMPAGESATIHDPDAPTNVRITFAEHCEAGAIEVADAQHGFERPAIVSRGRRHANVRLPPGSSRYRLLCETDGAIGEEAAANGTVRVVRDAGTVRITDRPQRSTVLTDGRRYEVLYENALPILTIRWGDAPPGDAFVLHVVPQGGAPRTFRASSASHTLASGALSDGTYELWFEASERRSRRSTLVVSYDNASPTAYLESPPPGSPLSGAEVEVRGGVVTGARVRAGGVELATDRRGRFAGTVPLPDDRDALDIRIAQRGVHYYLRRIAR